MLQIRVLKFVITSYNLLFTINLYEISSDIDFNCSADSVFDSILIYYMQIFSSFLIYKFLIMKYNLCKKSSIFSLRD